MDTDQFSHNYQSDCIFSSPDDMKNKHITVMGLGLNGGGIASAIFCAKHGAFVTITDMKPEEELKASVDEIRSNKELDQSKITFVLGKHEISDFENADCVIKNPGVKYFGNKFLAKAKHIETDISLFLRFTKAPVIAVTGSKGKSSTVSAIHYGLCEAGFSAYLGGNITVSPLTFLDQTNENTPVVLELSSWQLSDLRGRQILKPFISVLTTIVPDHQNWYGSMEPYVADKKLIYKDQDKKCFTLCKANDSWGNTFADETKGTVIRYSSKNLSSRSNNTAWLDEKGVGHFIVNNKEETILPEVLSVPGEHMRENLLNAAIVLSLMNVSPEKTCRIMSKYCGIAHRLEFFHSWPFNSKNYKFYNDSAATVPEAAEAAIKSFKQPLLFICGGTDKKCPFASLSETIEKSVSERKILGLYLLSGTATDELKKGFTTLNDTKTYNSLKELLLELKQDIQNNSYEKEPVIVFSPGATSFGMFKNEFDRGNTFKNLVLEIFQ